MGAAPEIVATAKPSRTRRQPSARPVTPAQNQRRRDQVAEEQTQKMAAAAYQKAYRKAQILIAQRQATEAAMKDAGIKPQQPQQQQAPTKPKTPSRKPQNRKPPGKR